MTATAVPGLPRVADGKLISTHPATGAEAGRFPVADETDIAAALARARDAARWWADLGFRGRRDRLLRWRSQLVRRIDELAAVMTGEIGRPVADCALEVVVAIDHLAFAARNARRVLRQRRVRQGTLLQPEYASWVGYEPYGVVGVIGPWNYPVHTPLGSVSYALAAGNAVVFKPSEYTPAIGSWLASSFAEVVPEQPVFQAVFGLGDVGALLTRAGVDKLAFTGSAATGRKVMAACAETLTPVVIEAGGKDALIVAADADLDAAADAAVWGAMTNAGQSCVGIERVYAVDQVYEPFLAKVVARAGKLTVGTAPDAHIGPIIMPGQLDVIRRHITDAVDRGGRAALGGPAAVQPPFVHPTVLVDVPEDAAAVREETFGPTLTVARVADLEEAVARTNASRYGLGAAVFGRTGMASLARRIRAGMVSINWVFTFAAIPRLPFGGVGESGFGRIHGDDGLREFARPKAVTRRRFRLMPPILDFRRTPGTEKLVMTLVRTLHGRRR